MSTLTLNDRQCGDGRGPSIADCLAHRNWLANLEALNAAQPELARWLAEIEIPMTWIFARDGTLSAHVAESQWWSDCSVPRRAAEESLSKMKATTGTSCFLAPRHAAEISVALEKLESKQALIAVLPAVQVAAVALHCADFTQAITARRLWLAVGGNWAEALAAMLTNAPGLPVPQQFIRMPTLPEDEGCEMIGLAQSVFSQEARVRATRIQELLVGEPAGAQANRPLCVVVPTAFRLWNDAGSALAEALKSDGRIPVECFEPERPLNGSDVALALAARGARALLVADRFRSDLPPVVRPQTPVVTWATSPRIVQFDRVGPRDGLIVMDSGWVQAAVGAGWPAARVVAGGWPVQHALRAESHSTDRHLAVIADTLDLRKREEFELSTHELLRDLIVSELTRDPLSLHTDAETYLVSRMRRMGVEEDGLDKRRLMAEVVVPAYQQGLVAAVLAAGLPVRLHGCGWNEVERFARFAAGPCTSRADVQGAAESAVALLHVWPALHAHPIDFLGRPVLRRASDGIVDAARRAANGKLMNARRSGDRPLDAQQISSFIEKL